MKSNTITLGLLKFSGEPLDDAIKVHVDRPGEHDVLWLTPAEWQSLVDLAAVQHERDQARAEVERLRKALASLRVVTATSPRDWSVNGDDAWIYGVLWGWGPLDDVRDGDAMPDVAGRHRWSAETQERLQQYARAVDSLLSPARAERESK